MLELLKVRNYAIIEEVTLEPGAGFTALTGETGAGKSILLGALKLVLGSRASSEVVRTGARSACIEAIFSGIPRAAERWLDEAGFAGDGDGAEVIVRREVLAAGTSRSFINGRAAMLSQLRDLGDLLVDMHGQNEHTSLFAPSTQLQLLDSYGDHEKELTAFCEAFREYRTALATLAELNAATADAERRKSFLQFQVNEIQNAALQPDEDSALDTERRRLVNAERLLAACSSASDLLYDGEKAENPASALIAAAGKALSEVATLDPSQEELSREADALRYAVDELAAKVRGYAEQIGAEPERLGIIEDRLQVIKALKRKYGADIDEIIATGEQLAAELSRIENHEHLMAEAEAGLEKARALALKTAKVLSDKRKLTAKAFEKQVESEIRQIDLPKARFQVSLNTRLDGEVDAEKLSESGADEIEFMVAINAGEGSRPMRKVASGGELSRIMLGMKSVLAKRDRVPTLIFDEIDVGVSGEAALRVGDKLTRLAESHQVLCITHLPQIAARGDVHLVVEKHVEQGRTSAQLRRLEGRERRDALARMLSGNEVDTTSLKYAEKLLAQR